MHYILLSILITTLCLLGILLFTRWLLDKSGHASLTERFKDAEFILNEHRAPESWLSRPSLFSQVMQGHFQFRPNLSEAQLLARLEHLISYFETAPFFESEEARTIMLEELRLVQKQWLSKVQTQGLAGSYDSTI